MKVVSIIAFMVFALTLDNIGQEAGSTANVTYYEDYGNFTELDTDSRNKSAQTIQEQESATLTLAVLAPATSAPTTSRPATSQPATPEMVTQTLAVPAQATPAPAAPEADNESSTPEP